MTHPEHELYVFKKRVIKARNQITIAIIICIPILLYLLFATFYAMAGLYLTIGLIIFSIIVFVIQTLGNYYDLNRARYHRFHGSTEELQKRLERLLTEKNLKYDIDSNHKYKKPYNPVTTKSIHYNVGNFSIHIFPFQGMNFNDIRILSNGIDDELLDNIEEQIFDLIKDKRGWDDE